MRGESRASRSLSRPLIDAVFRLANGRKAFQAYETVATSLGAVSVPLTLTFLTVFFAQGSLPSILVPEIDNLYGFLTLIAGLVSSLAIHELSHVITLANHGIKAEVLGISLSGVIGGYVKADVPKEDYEKIKFPFFSCGVGANLLVFLLALAAGLAGVPQLVPFAAVSFWFMVINSIPAPLMDGGKIFEGLLESLRLERFSDHISALIITMWILVFTAKLITL